MLNRLWVTDYPGGEGTLSLSLIANLEKILPILNESDRLQIEKHDWRRLLTVYIENVMALDTYAIPQHASPDCPVLYVRAIKARICPDVRDHGYRRKPCGSVCW